MSGPYKSGTNVFMGSMGSLPQTQSEKGEPRLLKHQDHPSLSRKSPHVKNKWSLLCIHENSQGGLGLPPNKVTMNRRHAMTTNKFSSRRKVLTSWALRVRASRARRLQRKACPGPPWQHRGPGPSASLAGQGRGSKHCTRSGPVHPS